MRQLGGRRGCSLSQLIATADAINHAIPTRDELASSIGALVGAGLVEVVGGKFRITHAGKRMKKHWKGGMFNWSKTLLPHLEELPRSSEAWQISDDDVARAYEEYTRR